MTNYTTHLIGEDHPNWKGDDVGYKALHQWVSRQLGKATNCNRCGSDWWVEWANISHEYKRDILDWESLCRRCHRDHDKLLVCKEGHEFTNDNTYIKPNGTRQCRKCKNIRWMKNYYRKKNENSNNW